MGDPTAMTVEELAESMKKALDRNNPTLFAGAGVGKRIGLPDWADFMELLAQGCDEYRDQTSGTLIRERTQRERCLEAATVFKSCDQIPEGERWKILSREFLRTIPEEKLALLEPLAKLSFAAIVTTNYDKSLHNICAKVKGSWIQPVERGDGTMRGASLRIGDFFIARIHGRAEQPLTMVVDDGDYKELLRDQDYLDFMLDILKSRSCIFLGFSFLDPAINSILDLYEERCGPTYEKLHCAFVPNNAARLLARLRKLNIIPLPYSPTNGHKDVWRAIRQVADRQTSAGRRAPTFGGFTQWSVSSLHRFVAFAYAQIKSYGQRQPVARLVQDGIVFSALNTSGASLLIDELTKTVQEALRTSRDESRSIVVDSLGRLEASGKISRMGDHVAAISGQQGTLDADLLILAQNVLDRMVVREGVKGTPGDKTIICGLLEKIFLARAWDISAHFAGSATGIGADLPTVVKRFVQDECSDGTTHLSSPGAVERALVDLFTTPEDRESIVLAKLGRAAFGLQLLLSTPRQALFQKSALPQKVYLDSNVLMPAITAGHPLRLVYVEALKHLREAAALHGQEMDIIVGRPFLNEVVSHRRLAMQLRDALGLDNPEKLLRHVLFYTATNTNVFIGAFASYVGRQGNTKDFASFLNEIAPYENEEQLSRYLQGLEVRTEEMDYRDTHGGKFGEIFGSLLEGYEHRLSPFEKVKDKILVEHEAQQLTRLELLSEGGHRGLFVTADNHLRRILWAYDRLRALAGSTVSHLGLVAMVDVMVGIEPDDRSMARLVWANPLSDAQQALFAYFVRLALQRYQEGMAMEMQEAARAVAAEASAEVAAREINLFGRDLDDFSATALFLDRYQDRFFQHWREAIDQRNRKKP